MPTIVSGPSGATDLATKLAADLATGRSARATFGARDVAFAWTSGLPITLATRVASAVVDGLTFNAVRIAPSGTPAKKVAKGTAKPTAIAITSGAVPLNKYAGLATYSTEDALSTEALTGAIAATMTASILLAYDADCIAALTVAGQPTTTNTVWATAILAAIGAVAANGGRPDVLVCSAADYAAVAGAPGVGWALDPTSGVVTLFGLDIVLSTAATAGTAFVLDSNAVLAVENSASPVAVVDPYSMLDTNTIRLAVEAFLGFTVTSPASVCKVTKT